MVLSSLCSPAIIYVAFSFIHILIDISKNFYNEALIKFAIMSVFATMMNILCQRGLGIVSWFIVFIPFITMTFLSQLILISLYQSSDKDKDKEIIDDINFARSKRGEVPAAAIEFIQCNASHCESDILSDYLIERGNSNIVTDIATRKYDAAEDLSVDEECCHN